MSAEDQVVQPMDDASPTKWHRAHTTWFFETFVLARDPGYRIFDPRFGYCFNSYYEAVGPRHPRPHRGLLTRPSVDEVAAYRAHVDEGLRRFLAAGAEDDTEVAALLELGIQHEQQHQELILTDILNLFAASPIKPAYRELPAREPAGEQASRFVAFPGGIHAIGHEGAGFAFDNEAPRHEVLLRDFRLAQRVVTNREWLAFMDDGGYTHAAYWLSEGWSYAQQHGWTSPGYWQERDGRPHQMTLGGLLPIDPAAPVTHISYYEADAFARWAGKRLPTEFEWEIAARSIAVAEAAPTALRPSPARGEGLQQMFGDVWQWTQSAYQAYPGFRAAGGAIGEYNGKFMISQQVLRGSSCATSPGHTRATYRNFFYPFQRWQFTGLRLADDGL